MQVIIVVGMAFVLILTAMVATQSNLECQRNGISADCETLIAPPELKTQEGGGFFTAAGNMITFLFGSIGYGISLAATGFGLPLVLFVPIGTGIAIGVGYVIVKLISLGGG